MRHNQNPAYLLYKYFWTGVDWVFPPHCGGCQSDGSRWCARCHGQVQRIAPPVCARCGLPDPGADICPVCRGRTPAYTAARSWGVFEGSLQNALHRLKYRRDLGLGEALARPMAGLLRELDWPVDMIVPLPLGRERLKERGYNQVALLALPLALMANLPYRPNALIRVRETASQVGLSLDQRQENVARAFQGGKQELTGKNVLVVDDVMTTGATLNAAASALLAAGAPVVYGLTLARAVMKRDY